MDLDALAAARRDEWTRLDDLGRKREYTGPETDELIERYQSGASDLSVIKTTAGSTAYGDQLSVRLSRARLRFTGTSANVLSVLPRFFLIELPAALYRIRWISVAVAVAFIVTGTLYALWAYNDPQVMANFGTDAQLKQLAEEDFVNYYSNNPAASFAGQVWTNNAWIAAQSIALGITGAFVPYMILTNAMNVGISAAVLFHYGYGDVFFLFILPHGLLELTCIFVAGAAGLRIFWSWIAPGAKTRGQSLADESRSLFAVAIGLAIALFVSGIIEGFVTPSPLHPAVKITIGSLALLAFLGYSWYFGRKAVRAGEIGDINEFDAGAKQIVAV